ncbi:hypothetical protein D3C80_1084340 [compost metagenome]
MAGQLHHPVAEQRQARFAIAAEAVEVQPQVMALQLGEVLDQQPLAARPGLPVQAATRIAVLVGAQPLEIVDAAARAGHARLLVIFRAATGGQQRAAVRPRIDQRRQVQIDPAPGYQQAEGEAALDPQARRTQPAALAGGQEQLHFAAAVGLDLHWLQRRRRPAQGDATMGPPAALQAQAKAGLLASEHRRCLACGQHQAGQVAVGMQDGDQAQRQQQEGQPVGQAVLVVDRRQQHQQQRHAEQQSLGGGQDEDPPLVQAHLARRRNALLQPATPARGKQAGGHQNGVTSRSSHCTSAPPPCPVGSAWSRRRWPATDGSTACTSSGIT